MSVFNDRTMTSGLPGEYCKVEKSREVPFGAFVETATLENTIVLTKFARLNDVDVFNGPNSGPLRADPGTPVAGEK